MVQKVLSARSVDEGRKGLMLNGFLTLATLLIIAIPGLIARGLFPGLERPDMVYPAMVINLIPKGLMAILLAALLSALISTLSAILNSTSTLFTIDFYARFHKQADGRKLVMAGKIASLVIITIAAFWAPNIGRFDSLLKYYQEMLSYISPPIVAAFILGIFSRRVNGRGVFIGLVCGLAIAVMMLFFRNSLFGNLHFLLIVPFLFVTSLLIMIAASRFAAPPAAAKLEETTFRKADLAAEWKGMKTGGWAHSYLSWAIILLVVSAAIWIVFR
jgi:SSS family solute:Na+ symporter